MRTNIKREGLNRMKIIMLSINKKGSIEQDKDHENKNKKGRIEQDKDHENKNKKGRIEKNEDHHAEQE